MTNYRTRGIAFGRSSPVENQSLWKPHCDEQQWHTLRRWFGVDHYPPDLALLMAEQQDDFVWARLAALIHQGTTQQLGEDD
ncbi:hypothetical protein LCGC14_0769600 [marine sediment metagenome]|uniref:Uncharacterized protein n=1 Tax=marine sediment metagenome TaxID=412755 RepID=A0A0F9T5P3_9ZZZZ